LFIRDFGMVFDHRDRRLEEGQDTLSKALNFIIPSDYAAGRKVQTRIIKEITAAGYGPDNIAAITLGLEEGLINAIKHGNRMDRKKKVEINVNIGPRVCKIQIEDQGPGFDRSGVPDPTLEENLEKCSGRGILLIEAYMDKVSWDRAGRRLTMVKQITAPRTRRRR
jgi:serine/threonine-protein kinase RsbW